MGRLTKKTSSDVKNFWLFRIAGVLAAIGGIRYQIVSNSDNPDVIEFIDYLTTADALLRNAQVLLRKIDYTVIVK